MPDLYIDPTTNDLVFTNGDIVIGSNIDDLKIRIRDAVSTIFTEWFLDTTKGIDYYNIVFAANPSLSVIEATFKATILNAVNNSLPEGIQAILTDFSLTINHATRLGTMTFTIAIGNQQITQTIPIGG